MSKKQYLNQDAYRHLCVTTSSLPIFMQDWWLDIVCNNAWDAAIVYNGEQVMGVWPYPVEQKLGVKLLRTPLLTPYLGPHIFYPPDLRPSRKDSFEHDAIAALLEQMPHAPVWHLTLPPGMKQAGLLQSKDLVAVTRQTFLLDVTRTEAELLADMKESHRKNIRQGMKELTIAADPAAVTTLYEWHKATLERKGRKVAHGIALLHLLVAACITRGVGTIWTASKGDEIQALIWQVWDEGCSYYLMGAQNTESGSHKAITTLLWHCMLEGKKRNVATFDLEGSMDPGVERFFRGFGGKRELYLSVLRNESMTWKLKQQIFG
jgi:hypothetical protein